MNDKLDVIKIEIKHRIWGDYWNNEKQDKLSKRNCNELY